MPAASTAWRIRRPGRPITGAVSCSSTWRENYARATKEIGLEGEDDLEWHAECALDLRIAARVMFQGMSVGWFTGRKLGDYFSELKDDPKNARQIVNGNDCDTMIAGYHELFLAALEDAWRATPAPEPRAGARAWAARSATATGAEETTELGDYDQDHRAGRQRDQRRDDAGVRGDRRIALEPPWGWRSKRVYGKAEHNRALPPSDFIHDTGDGDMVLAFRSKRHRLRWGDTRSPAIYAAVHGCTVATARQRLCGAASVAGEGQ